MLKTSSVGYRSHSEDGVPVMRQMCKERVLRSFMGLLASHAAKALPGLTRPLTSLPAMTFCDSQLSRTDSVVNGRQLSTRQFCLGYGLSCFVLFCFVVHLLVLPPEGASRAV